MHHCQILIFSIPIQVATFRGCGVILFGLFTLLLWISCEENKVEVQEETSPSKVHVAFAGDGWRAHTGHAAWIMALLNDDKKLSEAFQNVGTVSSNSGGSWFSTMLMYSDDFVNAIEALSATTTWSDTGWLVLQRNDFDNTECTDFFGEYAYLECVLDTYTDKDLDGIAFWKLIVEKLVFKDYLLENVALNSVRQPWAEGKALLLASTLLNNNAVLNKDGSDHRYYQACPPPTMPQLDSDSGSNCTSTQPEDVTPVTFSSLPADLSFIAYPFFPIVGTDNKPLALNIGYTKDDEFTTPPKKRLTLTIIPICSPSCVTHC
jgi:hypothetical protein